MLLFYITYPDEATAQRIADRLIEDGLIACANIFPMQSAYAWQGAIVREGEWVAIFKTRKELETQVEIAVRMLHPYEVPCIMRFEAGVNADYQNWIEANTQGRGSA